MTTITEVRRFVFFKNWASKENKNNDCINASWSAPILDFWGPYAKFCRQCGGGGGGGGWLGWKNGCHEHICPCFTPSRIALEKQYLFHGSACFQHVFLSRARDCMTFTLLDLTDFCFERVAVHHIRINDHSCFHNRWPNSKLKLKHIWKQLAYSA